MQDGHLASFSMRRVYSYLDSTAFPVRINVFQGFREVHDKEKKTIQGTICSMFGILRYNT
jgi:hypothetical protein